MTDQTDTPASQPTSGAQFWDMHSVIGRRSLALCAAGALIGLGIAGYGLFTAHGTRTSSVPAEDAAVVNAIPILRADLIQQVEALYTKPYGKASKAERRKVLEDMIREELYVQRGVEIGLANDDIDVRSALVAATEGQVAQDAMTTKPSDLEMQRWYASHKLDYSSEGEMTLHEWLLPKGSAQAEAAVSGLRGGANPQSLGLKSSGRVDDGAEFYFAARIHLGDQIFNKAKTLKDGEVSQPITAADGIHILQMIHNETPVLAPYDEVRDRVSQDVLADKVKRLQEGNTRFLHKRADIKIATDFE